MIKLHVILGSTRETRALDRVAPWVVRRARAHGAFEVEVVDLRDWKLPMFQEHIGTIGNVLDPVYSAPIVKAWNDKIKEADAYLMVTPEYLHSVPGELKNALDSVFFSYAFRNKPMAAVSYSASPVGGARAIEQLALIAIECEMTPIRNTVIIPNAEKAMNEQGSPRDHATEVAMDIALDDLTWFANALTPARAAGMSAPGPFRMRNAMMQHMNQMQDSQAAHDAPAAAVSDTDIEAVGTWIVTIQTPMGEQKPEITLRADGTGAMKTMMGDTEFGDVIFSGDHVSFRAEMGPVKFEFQGVVRGDLFTGSVSTPMGDQDVTGIRA